MALSKIQSRNSILSAIEEFNQLGRDAFLSKYGFGRARRYFLTFKRKLYDSKAIIGVAHRHEFPNKGQLKSAEFSGGEITVKRKLEELGFKVRTGPKASPVRTAKIPSKKTTNNFQAPTDKLKAALKKCRMTARRGYKIAERNLQESGKAIEKVKKDLSQIIQSMEDGSIRTLGIVEKLKEQLSNVVIQLEKSQQASVSTLEERRQRLDNFSITLFGRTMAGKSTLMEILTRGDGQSIGRGGQRTTRDVRSYSWNGLEITDVPGIAAFEGKVDEELAFKAASQADLVLFLITDDAPQPVEAKCLAKVRQLGKPVIGICNVKVAVDDKDDRLLFLKNPDKCFSQTRLNTLFKQFHTFADHHLAGPRVPFTATHLRSRFLAQQPQVALDRGRLFKASRFDRIEAQIIREVVDRGTFLRIKSFIDGTVVPIMDLTNWLLEFSAQNTSSWQVLTDKRQQFKGWVQKFRTHGNTHINMLVSKTMDMLRHETPSFAEDHVEDRSAGKSWEKLVKDKEINRTVEKLQKKLLHEYETELNEIARKLMSELSLVDTLCDAGHIKMEKIFDSKKAWNWNLSIISGGCGLATVFFPPLAAVPLLAIATCTGIGGRLGAGFMESREKKAKHAREDLTKQLMQNIDKIDENLRQRLRDWFNNELLGKQVDIILDEMNVVTSRLSQLADAQRTFAWALNDQKKDLERTLVKEALIQLKARNLKDLIVDVARVPGQATMLLIDPHSTFPGRIRAGLERLLDEKVLFVVATKKRHSLLAQAIGQGCDRDTISIDEKDRIAHIPFDDPGTEANTRVRLAQQLTGLHIMIHQHKGELYGTS